MNGFIDYKKYVPSENRPIEVMTKWGLRKVIFDKMRGWYRFTDCTHPMENCYCNINEIKGWRYESTADNEALLIQPNHYENEKGGNEIIESVLNTKTNYMSKGAIIITLIVAGIGLGILGWAQSESVHVAAIKPLSKSIEVANQWIWWCAVPGIVLIATGFVLLATGWGRNDK